MLFQVILQKKNKSDKVIISENNIPNIFYLEHSMEDKNEGTPGNFVRTVTREVTSDPPLCPLI